MKRVVKPAYVLVGLCLLDLATTLWVLGFHGGGEANPLMARFLEYGVGMFVAAKLVLIIVPVLVLEWARRRRPVFVHRSTWVAVAAYLVLYCSGSIQANSVQEYDSYGPILRQEVNVKMAIYRASMPMKNGSEPPDFRANGRTR